MKKLKIIITKPCQEAWDEMLPSEKGKFCMACHKEVVDFSCMSDRQLADHFKKPKAGTCGRFHEDQLARDIIINRKKIPWIRYFFQFTWPAMVLLFKSCGFKQNLKGEPPKYALFASDGSSKTSLNIMGDSIVQETMPDTSARTEGDNMILGQMSKGDIEIKYDGLIIGERQVENPPKPNKEKPTLKKSVKERLTLSPYFHVDKKRILERDKWVLLPQRTEKAVDASYQPVMYSYKMGGISIIDNSNATPKKDVTPPAKLKQFKSGSTNEIVIFPNPVMRGSMITARFPESYHFESYHLLDATGGVVLFKQNTLTVGSKQFTLTIPDHVSAGIYFLKLTEVNKTIMVKKILIE